MLFRSLSPIPSLLKKQSDELVAGGGGFQVGVYGDFTIRCARGLVERTKLRHGPLVTLLHCPTKMAGVPCAMEVRDLIIDYKARTGLALFATPPDGGDWYCQVVTENSLFSVPELPSRFYD